MSLFKVRSVKFKDILSYRDVDISDDVTFLVGESGAGKSTLLKFLNGTLSPTEGAIYYNDKNIEEINKLALRREVILTSQRLYLFNGSIRDNFLMYSKYLNREIPSDDHMKDFLHICQLDFNTDRDVSNLSGGEKQRVYNAIALSLNPKVLLLDEPTSSLDSETGRNFIRSITEYCRNNGIKLIIVSHDRSLADEFADSVVSIEKRDLSE